MPQSMSPEAQRRATAVFNVQGYLIERYPHVLDDEMEERFRTLLRAIGDADFAEPDEVELFATDALSRNYLVAQCSVLLRFANRLSTNSQSDPKLFSELAAMWEEMERLYLAFFGETPDAG